VKTLQFGKFKDTRAHTHTALWPIKASAFIVRPHLNEKRHKSLCVRVYACDNRITDEMIFVGFSVEELFDKLSSYLNFA
jgi:hypothetical protein